MQRYRFGLEYPNVFELFYLDSLRLSETRFSYRIRYSIKGISSDVATPISPIANPLTAPSTAPNSIARAVPNPCAADPIANPRATLLCI